MGVGTVGVVKVGQVDRVLTAGLSQVLDTVPLLPVALLFLELGLTRPELPTGEVMMRGRDGGELAAEDPKVRAPGIPPRRWGIDGREGLQGRPSEGLSP